MKRKIFVDIDGVMRDLDFFLFGNNQPREWIDNIHGETFNEYISKRLNILLDSPPTPYFPVICETLRKCEKINVITHQPVKWVPNTLKWLEKHFGNYEIKNYHTTIVSSMLEKEKYIGSGDIIIEDYPFFSKKMKNKILLIDKKYNQNAENYLMRIYNPEQLRTVLLDYVS